MAVALSELDGTPILDLRTADSFFFHRSPEKAYKLICRISNLPQRDLLSLSKFETLQLRMNGPDRVQVRERKVPERSTFVRSRGCGNQT